MHRPLAGVAAALLLLTACTTRPGASGGVQLSEMVVDQRARGEPGGGAPGVLARQLIRRGRMQVEVETLAPARERMERTVQTLGGRVQHVEVRTDEHAEYTLRVPSDRLDALMDSVAALGEVATRTVSVLDVTEQGVAAEARLAALRASRDRLLQLLARASTVQDVVTVERELARVQAEIESLEGRLNAMQGEIALSTLAVRLERKPVLGPLGLVASGIGSLLTKLVIWR